MTPKALLSVGHPLQEFLVIIKALDVTKLLWEKEVIFFPPEVRRTLKIVGSSEIRLRREPSYYKAKLKTL